MIAISGREDHGNRTANVPIRVSAVFPSAETISEAIPARPRSFLTDAQRSLSAPSASVMASNSAIDAMLKEMGVARKDAAGREQSLSRRIDVAVQANILTKGMSEWAHRIRLDANDQRHADEDTPAATPELAQQTLRLAKAIAELLFVLPAELPKATLTP